MGDDIFYKNQGNTLTTFYNQDAHETEFYSSIKASQIFPTTF